MNFMSMRRTLLVGAFFALGTALQAEFRTWTKTNGEKAEAELAGQTATAIKLRTRDGAIEIWSKDRLGDEDRAFLGLSGSSPTAAAATAVDSPAKPAPTKPAAANGDIASAPLTAKFTGKLVSLKNGKNVDVPPASLAPVRYYAFYFSAAWCPPCHRFTPELVKAYKQLKTRHPEFEIVFVSSDRSEAAMRDYMKDFDMTWPALRYSEIGRTEALRPYEARGIPNLVFVDGAGKVLSASYVNGEYVGPYQVLADIQKKLN